MAGYEPCACMISSHACITLYRLMSPGGVMYARGVVDGTASQRGMKPRGHDTSWSTYAPWSGPRGHTPPGSLKTTPNQIHADWATMNSDPIQSCSDRVDFAGAYVHTRGKWSTALDHREAGHLMVMTWPLSTSATDLHRAVSHHSYLTQCIYRLVLESQLPPKIVNYLFTITSWNIKLTVL